MAWEVRLCQQQSSPHEVGRIDVCTSSISIELWIPGLVFVEFLILFLSETLAVAHMFGEQEEKRREKTSPTWAVWGRLVSSRPTACPLGEPRRGAGKVTDFFVSFLANEKEFLKYNRKEIARLPPHLAERLRREIGRGRLPRVGDG